MPAVKHVYSNTLADGADTSVVRPSDWNSYHNQYMTISGNTGGQSTVAGTNIVFSGGNGVTLSATTGINAATIGVHVNTVPDYVYIGGNTTGSATNASTVSGDTQYFNGGSNITISNNAGTLIFNGVTGILSTSQSSLFQHTSATSAITASAVNTSVSSLFQATSATSNIRQTISSYQPFPLAVALTGSIPPNTIHFSPFNVDNNLSVTAIEVQTLMSNSSSAIATWGKTFQLSYGFYADGTGTNSTRIEQVAASTTGMTITASSNVSIAYSIGQGATSATFSSAASSHSLFNNAGAFKIIALPISTSLAPKLYYFAHLLNSTTSGANVAITVSQLLNNPPGGGASYMSMGMTGVSAANKSILGGIAGFIHSSSQVSMATSFAKSDFSNYSYQPFINIKA